ncbi:hypothetical protein EON80_28490, partial [bacterium]
MKLSYLSLLETARALKKPLKETAALLQEAEISHDDTERALRAWCRTNRYKPDGTSIYRYVRAVYSDFFIFEESVDYGETSAIFQAPYAVDEAGALTVGDPFEVRIEVKYIPVAKAISESIRPLHESARGSFREAKIGDDGLILVKLIDAGVGSSGYYAQEVLEAACTAGKFPEGLRMFANHQTEAERAARPEGDVENVVAITREAGYWDANGKAGPGVYAKAEVKKHWQPFVESMGYDMEVSVDGGCYFSHGEVDGRQMRIIEEIVSVKSVDFVTRAGRGGQWMSLQEAARESVNPSPDTDPAVTPNPTNKEVEPEMTEAEIQAAREAARTEGLKQGVALVKSAQTAAREALSKLALPELVKESIITAQIGDGTALPLKENALDVRMLDMYGKVADTF